MVCDEIGHSLPAMDPICPLPVTPVTLMWRVEGNLPPVRDWQVVLNQGMLVPLQSTQIVRCMKRSTMSLQPCLYSLLGAQ